MSEFLHEAQVEGNPLTIEHVFLRIAGAVRRASWTDFVDALKSFFIPTPTNSPTGGDVLTFDSGTGQWLPQPPSGGLPPGNFYNEYPRWDGAQWVPTGNLYQTQMASIAQLAPGCSLIQDSGAYINQSSGGWIDTGDTGGVVFGNSGAGFQCDGNEVYARDSGYNLTIISPHWAPLSEALRASWKASGNEDGGFSKLSYSCSTGKITAHIEFDDHAVRAELDLVTGASETWLAANRKKTSKTFAFDLALAKSKFQVLDLCLDPSDTPAQRVEKRRERAVADWKAGVEKRKAEAEAAATKRHAEREVSAKARTVNGSLTVQPPVKAARRKPKQPK